MDSTWWGYVGSLARWGWAVAAATVLIGGLLTRDVGFAVTCAIVAGLDLWLFARVGVKGRELVTGGDTTNAGTHVAFGLGLRLAVKAAALVLAALLPEVLSFWGAVAGALVVDTTVLVVGAVMASVKAFGAPRASDSRR